MAVRHNSSETKTDKARRRLSIPTSHTSDVHAAKEPRSRRPSRSLAFNLWLLILAIAVPGLALAASLGTLWASSEQRTIGLSAADAARQLAQALDRSAASVLGIMTTLAADADPDGDIRSVEARARRVTATLFPPPAEGEMALEVTLRDVTGARVDDGAVELPDDVAAWRPALAAAIGDGQTMVSDLVETSRGPVVAVIAPLRDSDTAALVLQVPLPMLAAFIANQPEDWIVAIFDSRGMTLARNLDPDQFVAQPGRADLVAAMQANANGTIENVSREDIALFNAFDRSQVTGWSAIVGVPRSSLTAPFWRAAMWVVAVSVILILLGAWIALRLQRRLQSNVRLLVDGAARMGMDQDPAIPKLQVAELDDVAAAMAKTSAELRDQHERQKALIAELAQAELAAKTVAAIVEYSEDAIWSKDLEGRLSSWNDGAETLFGYTSAEAIGQSVMMLVPEGRQDEEASILEQVRRGERVKPLETVRMRKDGSLVPVSLTVSPIRNAAGDIVAASSIARDISERKNAEERQRLLLREMNHRVKNLFTLVRSVVSLSGQWSSDPKDLAKDIQNRVGALARAHALTLSTEPGSAKDRQPVSLHELVRTIVEPYDAASRKDRVTITGADFPVGEGALTALALLLHEFTTNAAKYGALSVPDGRVSITCSEVGASMVLVWEESGGPPIREEVTRDGFGTLLANSTVTSAFSGEFTRTWLEDGIRLKLTIPRDRLSA